MTDPISLKAFQSEVKPIEVTSLSFLSINLTKGPFQISSITPAPLILSHPHIFIFLFLIILLGLVGSTIVELMIRKRPNSSTTHPH